MKKIIAISFLFFLFFGFASAEFSLDYWKFYKDIEVNSQFGMAEIVLDDEIFQESSKNLSDIRIVDSGNRETPFKAIVGKRENRRISYKPLMKNNSYEQGLFSSVILEMESIGNIVNNIEIKTSSENFQRNITIYGSADGLSWSTLKKDGYIYDYTDRKGNFKSQNTSILFPDSVYKYYKVEISDRENNPVRIDSVAIEQVILETEKEYARNPSYEITNEATDKITEILVDLGASGIPTSKIDFSVRNENFNRNVFVYSSNDKNDKNFRKSLAQGYIFRYDTPKFTGENLVIPLSETNDRYIKIAISNKDDAPLEITGIKTYSIYRKIAFIPKAEEKYRLFYGNNEASLPEYDLEKYFSYLEGNSSEAIISMEKMNEAYVPKKEEVKPFTERAPYVIPVTLSILSFVMMFIVYKFLKKD